MSVQQVTGSARFETVLTVFHLQHQFCSCSMMAISALIEVGLNHAVQRFESM
jgi:hypothetical protein